MESIKVSSTRQINTKRKEAGQLWQGRFFDRALRTVKEYGRAIEYIHWNPVKRGLVKRPGDWVVELRGIRSAGRGGAEANDPED
jgi:REP element-mobilizing transposase RayT